MSKSAVPNMKYFLKKVKFISFSNILFEAQNKELVAELWERFEIDDEVNEKSMDFELWSEASLNDLIHDIKCNSKKKSYVSISYPDDDEIQHGPMSAVEALDLMMSSSVWYPPDHELLKLVDDKKCPDVAREIVRSVLKYNDEQSREELEAEAQLDQELLLRLKKKHPEWFRGNK